MLHLELGFSSLFAYCVEALGMSEGTAGRRVAAARVCRRFPEAFEQVARGELHLCALCALAPHLTTENAADLFQACRRKTRRQIEELLAARFPRPDVREQIRRMPVRAQAPMGVVEQTLPSPRAIGESSATANGGEMPTISANLAPRPAPAAMPTNLAPRPAPAAMPTNLAPRPAPAAMPTNLAPRLAPAAADARRRGREIEPLSVARFGVHFTADAELRDLIERARALASHRLPNDELASLMKLMVASFVRQEEKRRFGIGARPRVKTAMNVARASANERPTPPGEVSAASAAIEPIERETSAVPNSKRGRYLPVSVRRATHGRDRDQCAFISPDGRRCNSRKFLEFDHVEPHARFGVADAVNIRLLCRAHNLLHARNCFGAMHLAAKIAARCRPDPVTQSR